MNKKLAAADSETESINIIGMQCAGGDENRKNWPATYLKWSILNLACSVLCIFGLFFSMAAFNYSFKTQGNYKNPNIYSANNIII